MIVILDKIEASCLEMPPGAYDGGVYEHRTVRTADDGPVPPMRHIFELRYMRSVTLRPLGDIGKAARELAVEKGFGDEDSQAMNATRIALMHSELSEMLEAVRSPELQMSKKCPSISLEAEEAADVLLRLTQYCAIRGIDLDEAVRVKHEFNKTRPPKHGKNF